MISDDLIRKLECGPIDVCTAQQAAAALIAARDEIARLCGEVDATIANCDAVCDSYADENQRLFDRAERAERELAAAVAKEREEIAKMCDERGVQHFGDSREDCWATKEARAIAAAIRARSNAND